MCQYDTLSSDIESGTSLTLEDIILGLGTYFFPVNEPLKQKRVMHYGMRKLHILTHLIDINEYVALFPGEQPTENFGMAELNEILLNSTPNSWSKHSYVQVFYCESITLKKLLTFLNSYI